MPHRDDMLIAAAGLVGGLGLWALGLHSRTPDDPIVLWDQGWAVLVPLAVSSACELMRRTRPRTALAIGTVAVTADLFTLGSIATLLIYTDFMYAAVLYGTPASARRIPWITGLVTVTSAVVPLAVWRTPEVLLIGVGTGLVTVVPAATGWIVRSHRDTAAAERLRAEQTALLAEMDRRDAVTKERARMARELHDMVANHLSAIAIHSTAALSLDDRQGPARDALGVIRENSVQGLAEMRRLIGLLRDSGAERAPAATPTLDGLDALVAHARTSAAPGTSFALRDLRPAGAPPPPAPVELAAYRIVQESLTNALKHAAPGEVTVVLGLEGEGTDLTVTVDSPQGHGAGPRAPGSGAGLVGMRERAELLGGDFAAGPRDRTWRVRAVLPLGSGT